MAYPHALKPAERRELYQDRMLAKQRAMSLEQVRELMRKTMHEALNRSGTIASRDFHLENVPAGQIDHLYESVLVTVRKERAAGIFQ